MKPNALSIAIAAAVQLVAVNAVAQDDTEENTPQVSAPAMEEVQVLGKFVPNEKRATSEVAELLSLEDLSIVGDSNIGESLKRVPGLSLVGGRFVYVRGMGERYSATYLNGSLVPSPQPLQRSVPLNLFDKSIINNVLVQKTYSPNFGADFSGGAIDIRSTTFPDEFFIELGSSGNFNSETTGKGSFAYSGGDDDFWGYDDGTRDLPKTVQSTIDNASSWQIFQGLTEREREALGRSFYNDWSIEEEDAPADIGLSGSIGNSWDLDNGYRIGAIGTVSFDNTWQNRTAKRKEYALGAQGQEVQSDFVFDRSQNEIGLNALASFGVEFSVDHSVKFTSMLVRQTINEASIEVGSEQTDNVSFADIQSRQVLQWTENEIQLNQLSGEHLFTGAGDLEMSWRIMDGSAERDSPDQRTYTYISLEGQPFRLANTSGAGGINNAEPRRIYELLEDDLSDYGVDFKLPIALFEETSLEFGVSRSETDRTSDRIVLAYQNNINLGLPGAIDFSEDLRELPLEVILSPDNPYIGENGYRLTRVLQGQSADVFEGEFNVDAYYTAIDTRITPVWRLQAGFRYEESEQLIFAPSTAESLALAEAANLEEDFTLPSLSLTWEFMENMQLRFGYSETINRPSLRELTPLQFRNPEDGRLYRGNPDLEIAELSNFDVRYELYFGTSDYFSAGIFYKDIDKPVELVVDRASGERSWKNAVQGENTGLELEVRKYFGEYFFAAANATYIDSEVDLDPAIVASAGQTTGRPLQGLSEYLFNLMIAYEPETFKVSLAYNVFGERIAALGTGGLPDVYEQPFHQLDLTLSKDLEFSGENFNLGFKVKNLLNEEAEFTQGGDDYETYDVGVDVSASISWKY